MGVGIRMSTGSDNVIPPGNPNPYVFTIERAWRYRFCWVSVVRYPNCANYEGRKVLITRENPHNMIKLDPHFSEDGNIIARFAPTEIGIAEAQLVGRTVIVFSHTTPRSKSKET